MLDNTFINVTIHPVIYPAGLILRTGRKYSVINVKEQKCSNLAVDT
jgi:hypothetical protein